MNIVRPCVRAARPAMQGDPRMPAPRTVLLTGAARGVDAIIHLAGISLEAPFEKILKANIEGTYHLYEAAREEGVGRVVFASSNHAVGYTPRPQGDTPLDSSVLIPIDTP